MWGKGEDKWAAMREGFNAGARRMTPLHIAHLMVRPECRLGKIVQIGSVAFNPDLKAWERIRVRVRVKGGITFCDFTNHFLW